MNISLLPVDSAYPNLALMKISAWHKQQGDIVDIKHLIEAIIKKWFCCHEWELLFERSVEVVDDWGDSSYYTVRHYLCKKCGKYKKIKSH